MSEKTFPRICRILRDIMELGDDIVLARNTVLSDLEIEDSELADIRDALEEEFEISIPDEKMEERHTVAALDSLVRQLYLGEEEEEEDPPEDQTS